MPLSKALKQGKPGHGTRKHRKAQKDSVELSGPRTSPAPVVFNTAPQMNISSALSGQTEKEWTVLCYIDGHNDLEPYAALSMLDLEAAGVR